MAPSNPIASSSSSPLVEFTKRAIELSKRSRCYTSVYGQRYCYSSWSYYGRWVLLGIVVVVAFFVLLCCCLTARRRRSKGTKPYYGTGWMAPPPKYGTHQNDVPLNNQNYSAPPAYGQTSGTTQAYGANNQPYGANNQPYGASAEYYGNSGVQQPPTTYQGDYVYPPAPAPPGGYK